jgi:hypothetical protein
MVVRIDCTIAATNEIVTSLQDIDTSGAKDTVDALNSVAAFVAHKGFMGVEGDGVVFYPPGAIRKVVCTPYTPPVKNQASTSNKRIHRIK